MLIKELKTQENEGATSKYPEHTDIKVFGHIPEVFVLKIYFLLRLVMFFFGDCRACISNSLKLRGCHSNLGQLKWHFFVHM